MARNEKLETQQEEQEEDWLRDGFITVDMFDQYFIIVSLYT